LSHYVSREDFGQASSADTALIESKRCWTCGACVHECRYDCPSCQKVQELQSLRASAAVEIAEYSPSAESHTRFQQFGFPLLERLQQEALGALIPLFVNRQLNVANLIEWGFNDTEWQLLQQTRGLCALDRAVKTSNQTLASEWRNMADELRRRGVLDESEEFFLKALEMNRLDYRLYVGLAHTYLQNHQFDKAETYLKKSLPHAPVQDFDYKSYSYRLLGHLHACQGHDEQAVSMLRLAIELSPQYSAGYYDCAQYAALTDKTKESLACLTKASDQPFYAILAQKGPEFAVLKHDVRSLLLTNVLADEIPERYYPVLFELAQDWIEHEPKTHGIRLIKHLIDRQPDYFALIFNEHQQNAVSPEVQQIHAELKAETVAKATEALNELERRLQTVAEAVAEANKAAKGRKHSHTPLKSEMLHKQAVTKFEQALELLFSQSYAELLTIIPITDEINHLSQRAHTEAQQERKRYTQRKATGKSEQITQVGSGFLVLVKTLGKVLFWSVFFGMMGTAFAFLIAFVRALTYPTFFTIIAVAGILGFLIGIKIEKVDPSKLKRSFKRKKRHKHMK